MPLLRKASNVVQDVFFCTTFLALLKSGIRFLSQPTVTGMGAGTGWPAAGLSMNAPMYVCRHVYMPHLDTAPPEHQPRNWVARGGAWCDRTCVCMSVYVCRNGSRNWVARGGAWCERTCVCMQACVYATPRYSAARTPAQELGGPRRGLV